MAPILGSKEQVNYGIYDRKESSEDEPIIGSIRPPVDPNSRLSEIGFLVGTAIFVTGLIVIFTQFMVPKHKFSDSDDDAIRR
jgi:hypothetical protein